MSLVNRLATPFKTLLRNPSTTRSMVAARGEFQEPLDNFVRQALTSAGLMNNAEGELATLRRENVNNMGLLKEANLNEVGLTVLAITRG